MTGAHLNRGGSRQDYETPPEFMEAVRKRFGPIACDLAATKENAKAPSWIGENENSLLTLWYRRKGNLWLNPPFSNIAPWAEKCAYESGVNSSHGAKILFLVPASVGSNWFARHVYQKAIVLFLNGRITFVGAKDPYPKDCILACYGYGNPSFEIWNWKQTPSTP